MAKSVKTLSVYVNLNAKQFTKGLRRLERSLKKLGNNLKNVGANMTRSITLPMVAAGAGAVKLASEFDASMTKIQTLVGTSGAEVEKLKQKVLDLAGETAQAPKDLADGLFFIQSAGFKGAESLEVLEVSAKASAIGMGELTDIANATTSIMTAYADQNMTASQAGDLLHETLKQGKFEASEFMNKLGSVVPTAAAFGISFEQLGASVATMSKLSGDASGSLVAVNRLMMSLNAPAEQQSEILNRVFGSYKNLSMSLKSDFMGTLQQIFTALEGNDQELVKVFGSAKAVQAAFATAGLQGETYAEVLNGMNESLGNVNQGFTDVSETSSFKFQQSLTELKVAAIELGNAIMPMAIQITEFITEIARSFSNLSDEGKKKILLLAGALALLPPAITLIGTIITGVSALMPVLSAIVSAIGSVAGTIGLPLLAVVAIVAVLAAAFALVAYNVVKDWDKVKHKIVDVVNWFINLYNESILVRYVIESFKTKWKNFFSIGKAAIDQIIISAKGLGGVLTNIFNPQERRKAWDEFKNSTIDNFDDLIKDIKDTTLEGAKNIRENVNVEMITSEDLDNAIQSGKDMGKNFIDGVKSNVMSGLDNLLGGTMFGGGGTGGGTDGEADAGTGGIQMIKPKQLQLDSNHELIPPQPLKKAEDTMASWSDTVSNQFYQTFDNMTERFNTFAVDYAEGFSDMVTTTIIEGGNLAEAFGQFIKQMLIDLAAMLIKMVVFKTLMSALGMPTLPMGGGGGGGFLGSLFGMAEGGLVTGATPVMVGEGRGINMSNPEVIAPLDKLRSYISGGSGRLHGEIMGSNILLSNTRSTNTQDRVGGSSTDF